jgi:elongation factor 1 alpha-like protein
LSAKGFFDDCPWFGIPPHRHANILIEPLYPRLGLLGGSPSSEAGGKMSKLAALAAKRRQKENEKALAAGSDKLPPQEKQTSDFSGDRNHQLSPPDLLDKTFRKGGFETRQLDRINDFHSTSSAFSVGGCESLPLSVEARAESTKAPTSLEPPAAIRAVPSPFAAAIIARNSSTVDIESGLANDFASVMSFSNTRAKPFDFADPSPDDVATKARSSKGSN